MNFIHKYENGVSILCSDKFSIIECDERYYIRMLINGEWTYPYWGGVQNGFDSPSDAQEWLSHKDVGTATINSIASIQESIDTSNDELDEAMNILGFQSEQDNLYILSTTDVSGNPITITVENKSGLISASYSVDGIPMNTRSPKTTTCVSKVIRNIERILSNFQIDIFHTIAITPTDHRSAVMAAVNTRNLAQDLVKVKSSNVWAYGLNIKNRKDRTGDLLVQFKAKGGGAGDIYMYYDVPVQIYRRWQSAPSKGHYFWVYIRGRYSYSKLTGDKRGKMRGAVN